MRLSRFSCVVLLATAAGCGGGPTLQADESAACTAAEPVGKVAYTFPDLDHGLIQSPINILSDRAESTGKYSITVHFDDQINAVKNLGNTVQLDFVPGSTITYDGKVYEFKQLHFHTPSEHLIDGITFPMEMHVVNVRQTGGAEARPEYLVVGMLFRMGRRNPFIEQFLDLIPLDENGKRHVRPGRTRLMDMLTEHEGEGVDSFYRYQGSLTTPPYTETVSWFIDKTIYQASPEQIQRINMFEGNNARRIQGTFGRSVDK